MLCHNILNFLIDVLRLTSCILLNASTLNPNHKVDVYFIWNNVTVHYCTNREASSCQPCLLVGRNSDVVGVWIPFMLFPCLRWSFKRSLGINIGLDKLMILGPLLRRAYPNLRTKLTWKGPLVAPNSHARLTARIVLWEFQLVCTLHKGVEFSHFYTYLRICSRHM